MGLESFETDGPRTRSRKTKSFSEQTKLRKSDFEDEWGMSMVDASNDDQFVKQRLEEGYDISDLCELFHWIEHSVISRLAELVDDGVIDIDDVPESTHMDYNEKPMKHYIRERNKSRPFSSTTTSDESSSSSSGLDSFRT